MDNLGISVTNEQLNPLVPISGDLQTPSSFNLTNTKLDLTTTLPLLAPPTFAESPLKVEGIYNDSLFQGISNTSLLRSAGSSGDLFPTAPIPEGLGITALAMPTLRNRSADVATLESPAAIAMTIDRAASSDLANTTAINSQTLTPEILAQLKSAAIDRWAALGLSPAEVEKLHGTNLVVDDLASNTLAETQGYTIVLDWNASEIGWYVDSTPLDNSEFTQQVSATELVANGDSIAFRRVDLLSAIAHEYGHILGLEHSETDALMRSTIPIGERLLPSLETLQGVRKDGVVSDRAEVSPTNTQISFSNNTFAVNEDGSSINQITLVRTGDTSNPVSATINFSDGTASSGIDYNIIPIAVNFAAGEISKPVNFIGQGLYFNGVNSTVSSTNLYPSISDNFSIEFWANPTATRNSTAEANSGGSGVGGQRYAFFPVHGDNNIGSGHAGVGVSVGTNGISVFEHSSDYLPSPLVYETPLSGWNHIAIVYNSKTPSLYLNGQLVKTGLKSDKIVHPSFQLGGASGALNYGVYQGQLDDVQIWATARSQSQIQSDLSKELTGTEAGLVGYWNLNSVDNNIVRDSSSYQNNGTVLGAQVSTGIVTTYPIIINDTVYEPTETISLSLSNPTGGATLGSQNQAVLKILDNDLPPSISDSNLVYSNKFESSVGTEWSNGATNNAYPSILTQFLGRSNNDSRTLTLNTTPGQSYRLEFDLYVIDTWDGSPITSYSPDYFNVSIDGSNLFDETFSNTTSPQSFHIPDIGDYTKDLVFGSWGGVGDSIYRRIPLTFTATGSTTQINFFGSGLEALENESWGIDNVKVWTNDLNAASPNLVVSDINTASSLDVNTPLNLSWTVTNQGNGNALNSWFDRVYLSKNTTIDGTAILLGSFSAADLTPLAPNTSYNLTKTFNLPVNTIGDWNILVVADSLNLQPETDESDNTRFTPLHIKTPDLIVSNITAPSSSPERSSINLGWIVINQGDTATTADWNDYIYLSNDAILDDSDRLLSTYSSSKTPLATGSSYQATSSIILPERLGAGTRYLIVATDRNGVQVETNENNNYRAIPIEITVPDLIVESATSPNTLVLGDTASLSWTVKNQGGVNAVHYWYDQVYLSDDEVLDASDTSVGKWLSAPSPGIPIPPNTTYTVTQAATIPTTKLGNRYLLFVADVDNYQYETNENNNIKAIPVLIKAPDLVVTNLTAPSIVDLGGQITVNWEVKNQGDVAANTDWIDTFYLSDDAIFDSSDQKIGEKSVADKTPLSPGGTYTNSQVLTVNATTKADRYLLAVTDVNNNQGETDETNNVRAIPIHINGPDLAITDFKILDSQPTWGQPVTVSWTVTNKGDTIANRDWFDHIWLSSDGIIDGYNDTFLGEYYTADTLAAGASYTKTATINIPYDLSKTKLIILTDTGAPYYPWHNDRQAESNETNNSKTIESPFLKADLVISDFKILDPNPTWGQAATVSWTVTNQGAATANRDWFDHIWISADGVIDGYNDTFLGEYYTTDTLAAGASYTKTATINIPYDLSKTKLIILTDTGAPYYPWHNDRQAESDETNNSRTIESPFLKTNADLVISDFKILDPNPTWGQAATVSWTVTNQGAATANRDWFDHIWISSDGVIDGYNDTFLGEYYTADTLAAGASYTKTATINIPYDLSKTKLIILTDTGAPYYPWHNDRQAESDETNNSRTIESPFLKADLVISDFKILDPNPTWGQAVTVSWTVTNQGAATANRDWFDHIWISSDGVIDGYNDTFLGEYYTADTLAAGASYTKTATINIPYDLSKTKLIILTDTGAPYYPWHNDRQAESDDSNNTKSITLPITPPNPNLPDLIVTNLTLPSTVTWGEKVAVAWTVKNQGNYATTSSWSDYLYASDDPNFDINDTFIGFANSPTSSLASGASYTTTQDFTIPFNATGKRYVLVVANRDRQQSETLTNNNVSALDILGSPDLTITAANAPGNTTWGETKVPISWTVKNQGTHNAIGNWYDAIYISDDDILDASDAAIVQVPQNRTPLNAAESYTVNLNIDIPANAWGKKYLIFGTNRYKDRPETNTNNNFKAVKIGGEPDLVVSQVSVPSSTIWGNTVPVSWTVTNRGNASALVVNWSDYIYASSDDKLDSSDVLVSYSQFDNQNRLLGAGESYTVNKTVTIPTYASGKPYLLFITDRSNYQRESNETNNINSFVINASDLAVTNLTAPTTSTWGATIPVTWTVTNQGGLATTGSWIDGIYLSNNSTFDNTAVLVGQATSGTTMIAGGASYTQSANITLPSNFTGQPYLFVVSNSQKQLLEAGYDNNIKGLALNVQASDLVVTSFNTPSTITPGQLVNLSWTVKNQGTYRTDTNWRDRVYLSIDDLVSNDDLLLSDLGVTNILQIGDIYTLTTQATLPQFDPTKTWKLLIKTDANSNQAEVVESNNISG